VLTVIPIRDPRESDETQPCRSALVMESFEQTLEPKLLTERLDIVGKHAATALYNAQEYRTIPLRWLWLPLATLQKGLGGKGRAITAGVSVGVALLLAAMVFIPYPLKMDSKGQLLPQKRAWVFSPTTGHVRDFYVVPNADVLKGQNLILMHDSDLQSKLANLTGEINAAAQEIQACNTRLGAALANENERITINIEKRKQESILALKLKERADICELTNSKPGDPGFYWVRAPMDGTVLNADFKETLTNKFVRPSDPLLRLGDQPGAWEVELKIPQKHVGQILAAFGSDVRELDVDLLLLSDPTHVYKGKLARDKISGEANVRREETDETEPVLIATVRLDGADIPAEDRLPRERLLTGTEVHAKVRCGDHALGYSLFYGAWEFFFEKIVFFF
jgi:HlyD family secretion protein